VVLTRRALLWGLTVGAMGATAACAHPSQPAARRGDALPIPPLAPVREVAGVKNFELVAAESTSQIKPGVNTRTLGYSGSILGPTVRVKRGDRVQMNVRNALKEETTVHWHGLHVPAKFDGGPHQMIAPGESWSPAFTIDQPAATLWYHPHPHGSTSRQAYLGLAGLLLIDDDDPAGAVLPSRYGVDDVPLVLQDKRFTADGQLDLTDRKDVGLIGDVMTCNGVASPTFTATTDTVRFRVLNGSTMRVVNLAFADNRTYRLVGSDGGLLRSPIPATSTLISPGERAEILVDMHPGDDVQLLCAPIANNLEMRPGDSPDFGTGDRLTVLTMKASPTLAAGPKVAPNAVLNPTLVDPPTVPANATVRNFGLREFTINNKLMDMNRIDDVVPVDTTETWVVQNKDKWIHNFHIHDTQFRILSTDRLKTPVMTAGWKDTVLLPPGAIARLQVRFHGYTDTTHPYMYHCHLMYHEDRGMMGQFLVVTPADIAAGVPTRLPDTPMSMPGA
jgi:suppressor of ftsI